PELLFLERAEGGQDLWEVAGHRPGPAAEQLDLLPVAEDERPEAVPLRLVLPAVPLRDPVGRGRREHGFHVLLDRQLQGSFPQVSICCGSLMSVLLYFLPVKRRL